jgi:hypothetical protein
MSVVLKAYHERDLVLAQPHFVYNLEGILSIIETVAEGMAKDTRRGRPPKTLGEAKRAQFNTRLRPSLKAALDAAARANGRSVSEEVEARLEQSLTLETFLGGRDALIMAATFALAGQRAAEHEGHPEWGLAQWRQDPVCYETAILAVAKSLWLQHPDQDGIKWSWREWVSRLSGQLAGRYAPNSTIKDRTVMASVPDFETARREREGLI